MCSLLETAQRRRASALAASKRFNFRSILLRKCADSVTNPEKDAEFGLVIRITNMPNMDGFETDTGLVRLRGSHRSWRLSVSSSDIAFCRRVSEAGGNDFMLRPLLDEEFYCRVNRIWYA